MLATCCFRDNRTKSAAATGHTGHSPWFERSPAAKTGVALAQLHRDCPCSLPYHPSPATPPLFSPSLIVSGLQWYSMLFMLDVAWCFTRQLTFNNDENIWLLFYLFKVIGNTQRLLHMTLFYRERYLINDFIWMTGTSEKVLVDVLCMALPLNCSPHQFSLIFSITPSLGIF